MITKKNIRITYAIREEPFFRGMPAALADKIQTVVYHRQYDARQVIFFPEDACDFVYWVRSGRIKVMRVSGTGRELTLRHAYPGDMIGAEVLGGRRRWQDYGEALEPAVLCLIRTVDFLRLVREEALFAQAVAQHVSQRAVELEENLVQLAFLDVRSRIAAGILNAYQRKHSAEGGVSLTHQELANLVSAARETTTAILHEFQADGVISLANRRVTVHDAEALKRLAAHR